MAVKIRRGSSRLTHSDLVVVDGIEFFTRPEIPEIDPSSDDNYYRVVETDRIDTIAQAQYKRFDWWWVVAHRNNLGLLPSAIQSGDSLIIPRAALVRRSLF